MKMKRNEFWGLYEQIPAVKASEELSLLSITRTAYHAKDASDLANKLEHRAQGHQAVEIDPRIREMFGD
jgi:hypothetical protein